MMFSVPALKKLVFILESKSYAIHVKFIGLEQYHCDTSFGLQKVVLGLIFNRLS